MTCRSFSPAGQSLELPWIHRADPLRLSGAVGLALLLLAVSKPSYGQYVVRLGVSSGLQAVTVTGKDLVILDADVQDKLGTGLKGTITLRARPEGVEAVGLEATPRAVLLRGHGSVIVDGKALLGEVEVRRTGPGLQVVNRLPLETYLEGVVAAEMEEHWPVEALKAQAVAARTFAMRRCLEHENEAFDLSATTLDQVYRGIAGGKGLVQEAVRQTVGEVLTFGSVPAEAMFFSCCGGRTLPAAEVFGTAVPYLVGVEDPDCQACPSANWSAKVPVEVLSRALEASGRIQGGIQEVRPMEGGVAVVTKPGGRLDLKATELRNLLGGGLVLSNRFTVSVDGANLLLSGHGRGHGVGMCQWGARGMAESGKAYRDILKRYYPGTILRKMY